MTKQELKRYRHLKKKIELLELEIKEAQDNALNVRSFIITGLPRGNRREDAIAASIEKITKLESCLYSKINQSYDLLFEIEQAIDTLPPLEENIIRMYYIFRLSWNKIAKALDYSVQRIWQLHGDALEKIRDY